MKRFWVLVLALAIVFPVMATTKIMRLGPHPFYKSKHLTPQDLYKIAIDFAGDVKIGFEEAGYGDLYLPFLDQLKNAKVEEGELQPGTHIEWMLFRKHKKVSVIKDAVWAGRKPMKVYKVTIYHDLKAYHFIVPLICGNISLQSVEELPAPICALSVSPSRVEINNPVTLDLCGSQNWVKGVVKVMKDGTEVAKVDATTSNCKVSYTATEPGNYTFSATVYDEHGFASSNGCTASVEYWKNQPPVCDLKVSPTTVLAGEEITLDASGSSDPEGKLIGVKFIIKDDKGNVVVEKTITEPPYVYRIKPTKAGSFVAVVIAEDDHHVTSASCQKAYEVLKRGFFVVETGILSQSDPRLFVPLRAGYEYRVNYNWRVTGLVGYNFKVKKMYEQEDYGNPITADLLFSYHPTNYYFGLGVGAWIVSGDNKGDIIGKVGYGFYSTRTTEASLFFEGRLPFVESKKSGEVRLLFGIGVRF